MTNEQTDWRALCADLIQLDKEQPTEYSDWKKRWNAAVSRVSTALAQPEPEGVTDEEIAECLVAAGVDAMEGESDGTIRMYWEGWNEQILSGIRAVIAADRAHFARPTIDPTPDSAMTELRAASAEARPAGGLVERVEEAIITGMVDGDRHAARAAIREVASWLRSEYPRRSGLGIAWANLIEQEADRG